MYDPNDSAEVLDTDLENFEKFGEYAAQKQRIKFLNDWINALFTCKTQQKIFWKIVGDSPVSFKRFSTYCEVYFDYNTEPHFFRKHDQGALSTFMQVEMSRLLLFLSDSQRTLPKEFYDALVESYKEGPNQSPLFISNYFFSYLELEFEGQSIYAEDTIFCFNTGQCIFKNNGQHVLHYMDKPRYLKASVGNSLIFAGEIGTEFHLYYSDLFGHQSNPTPFTEKFFGITGENRDKAVFKLHNNLFKYGKEFSLDSIRYAK